MSDLCRGATAATPRLAVLRPAPFTFRHVQIASKAMAQPDSRAGPLSTRFRFAGHGLSQPLQDRGIKSGQVDASADLPRYRLHLDAALAERPAGAARPRAGQLSAQRAPVLKDGDGVLTFNGPRWRMGRRAGRRRPQAGRSRSRYGEIRPRTPQPDLHYLFAPLKHARLDYWPRRPSRWVPACSSRC